MLTVAAVVTEERSLTAVQGQGNQAVLALENGAAIPAKHERGKTAAIDEQQTLPALLQRVTQGS